MNKNYTPKSHLLGLLNIKKKEKEWAIQLKVQIDSDKKIYEDVLVLVYGSILEIKVLKNGDILLISQLSIQIYTIEHSDEDFKIILIYCWFDELEEKYEEPKLPIYSLKSLLNSFEKNLNYYFGSEILPSPTLYAITLKNAFEFLYRSLDVKNSTLLKLYGKHVFKLLLKTDFAPVSINELLNYCYDHSLSSLKKGDIYSFILIISKIAFLLQKFEKSNKNKRFTEEFLSKTNMLIGHIIPCYYHENEDSLLFNLQHYGRYVDPHNLSNTSFFNYFIFWISKKCDLLEKSYPRVYQILKTPYSLYLYYNYIYPQETVVLIFPLLLGFATYSENYSYSELFYLQGNPFTSLLDTPDYFKWWNIKAIISFKWNTYGRLYYFIIWAIYSTFMCCFLIVSTIPEHKISWNNQAILLVATIFFGLFHFIFEVRQFIYNPKAYIASPWNWFDLAAILVPTVTSLIWLHVKTPATWIITIAAFLLEFKFLLFFRTLSYFGAYFAIMIGVAQKVFSFLIILGVMIIAFAHSLHLLLRPTSKYTYDQPSFTDDSNNPWNLVPTYQFISSNGTVGKSTLIETPDDSTNLFTMLSTSILAVYFMLTVIYTAIFRWYRASVKELKKYIESVEDKKWLDPKILKITKTEDCDEKLKNLIDETLTNK
ncbi:hypothetical protein C2G38_2041547 [Gigaspora rosea]|uniref:Uncharacterized protein n=1 Tax=Gigaspora rosea TaxID=44941 RepID=A0A397UUB8_9GLOM|nr:hypothetical protein C2G38_2041547 [Gigaspora rosea]